MEDGIQVHWCAVPYANAMGFRDRLGAFFRFALLAARRSIAIRGDVIFATSTPLTIALPAIASKWWLRKPLVLEIRDLWPDVPIAIGALRHPLAIAAARALEWCAYHSATSVVALSPGMREGVIARGVPGDRVSVIPNSADVDLFQPGREAGRAIRDAHPWLAGRPLVLYAGTLGLMNDVRYLVRVAAALKPLLPEARFAILGDGAERSVIADLAREVGVLGETLFLLEPVAKAEVVQWFAAADLVTSLFRDAPAMWANSANKFFDGLAAGRPVAINYGGWQADLLTKWGAGVVLPVGDPDAAARLVAGVLTNAQWLTAAGSQARSLAEKEFDRDRLASRLIDVIESAAAR